MSVLQVIFPWIKVLHILAVISWMAGIFYLPRLFVHHSERASVGSETSEIFKMMEHKLMHVIMIPAMVVTWASGLLMVLSGNVDFASFWFAVKFTSVLLMTAFHEWCRARLKDFHNDQNALTGRRYRIFNELPTLLLIIIVIMVIIRPFS